MLTLCRFILLFAFRSFLILQLWLESRLVASSVVRGFRKKKVLIGFLVCISWRKHLSNNVTGKKKPIIINQYFVERIKDGCTSTNEWHFLIYYQNHLLSFFRHFLFNSVLFIPIGTRTADGNGGHYSRFFTNLPDKIISHHQSFLQNGKLCGTDHYKLMTANNFGSNQWESLHLARKSPLKHKA